MCQNLCSKSNCSPQIACWLGPLGNCEKPLCSFYRTCTHSPNCFMITRHFESKLGYLIVTNSLTANLTSKELPISGNKIYLQRMDVCSLSSKQTVKSICHKFNNIGKRWNFGRFQGEQSATRKSSHLFPYSKDIDGDGSVVELSVGHTVLSPQTQSQLLQSKTTH